MPIIGKHHVHPYSIAVLFHSDLQLGRRSRLPLPRTGNRLVDQHLPHACFRRTSPQRFWFRGLWRKPGQRFAVCGGNPAWPINSSSNQGRCYCWPQGPALSERSFRAVLHRLAAERAKAHGMLQDALAPIFQNGSRYRQHQDTILDEEMPAGGKRHRRRHVLAARLE